MYLLIRVREGLITISIVSKYLYRDNNLHDSLIDTDTNNRHDHYICNNWNSNFSQQKSIVHSQQNTIRTPENHCREWKRARHGSPTAHTSYASDQWIIISAGYLSFAVWSDRSAIRASDRSLDAARALALSLRERGYIISFAPISACVPSGFIYHAPCPMLRVMHSLYIEGGLGGLIGALISHRGGSLVRVRFSCSRAFYFSLNWVLSCLSFIKAR